MASISFEKNHFIGLLIAIATLVVISLLFISPIFVRMELSAIDYLFYARDPDEKSKDIQNGAELRLPNKRARKDIIIFGIDERTIRYFSDRGIQWPFPWDIHATFIRYVGSGKPQAILYDIMFLDHKKGEDKLADAIRGSGNVFLDYPFETKYIDRDYADQGQRLKILNQFRFPLDPHDTSEQFVYEAVPPTPLLAAAARGIGLANIFIDKDNVNRTMPLLIKLNGWYYPSIDLMVVMHYYGIGKNDIEISWGTHIKLKNLPGDKMAKPNNKREIVIPIDDRGFMDINFIGGFGSFDHYPFSYFCRDGDMLKENNKSLLGKIVLVAAYAVTGIATDQHQSPYGATFGVDHHANAINTILNQNFLHKLTNLQNILIMLIIAVVIGLLMPRLSIIASLVFTGMFAGLYLTGSYFLFNSYGYIAAMATPVIQVGVTFTLIITYRVVTEQREKRYIRQTFSKFVSKSVVDELLKSPEMLKLGGEKKLITVLFSDIRDFTTLSEKMLPQRLMDHLNYYLQVMTDIVIKYDGTLDKYVGDEIMAFWGAPIPQENHALLACTAAVEMIAKLDDLNRAWRQEGKTILRIGVGINTGDMIVGNVGSSSRMNYTLIGDDVNLGARLEGTNKIFGTAIIISESTYDKVKDRVIARELGLIRVKGKEQPVMIYELIDMKQ
ncbi:MAG: hypothetical protein A2176_00635 [Spirochaetes bacterium RBG_13_51_14]|nr:MAG: hypothetical protein A2176_00635 [Spirochaetes bacterium RBG_13_51_14]